MFEICLLFHSAQSDNHGVTALTVSQVEILRTIGRRLQTDIRITILGWNEQRAPVITGDDIRHVNISARDMIDPRGALAHLKRADLVIDIGAGDSFTDIYGMKRFRRLIWMKNLAALSGTPIVLAPQTFGPFRSRIARFWATRTARKARVIATRDDASVGCLTKLGVSGPICLSSDVALRLPFDHGTAQLKQTSRPRVGINVSGLLWNGGYTGANQFGLSGDYREVMRAIVRRLAASREHPEIWLIPHVISEGQRVEDDLSACQCLALDVPEVMVAPSFASPGEAKAFIAEMDYFSGSRMHACIAAFSTGVPVVPLAYSRKFQGLFGSLGYNHTIDCRTVQADSVIEGVVSGFENRKDLAQSLSESLGCGLRRLGRYEQAVEDLIAELLFDQSARRFEKRRLSA